MRAKVVWLVPAVLIVCVLGQRGSSAKEGSTRTVRDAAMLQTINDDLEVVGSLTVRGPHPWADVTAFGATPNDSSDDTAAIQAAIDSVGVSVGGVVYIPKGWYKTTGVVVKNTYRNVRIVGAGRASHLELTASGPLIRFAANDGGVEHVTLDCRGVSNSVGLRVAPEIETASGVTTNLNSFHDLVVGGCTVAGIVLRAAPQGGCYYNTFHTIHILDSTLGIHAVPGVAGAPGANRNNFFSVRIGQASGGGGEREGGGVRIDAGNTNNFYALALEGLARTGIQIAEKGPNNEPTDGNRFYGTIFEAVGVPPSGPTFPEIDNQNVDTEFLGSHAIDAFASLGYHGKVGIGTGTERPKTKLHVDAGGSFSSNPGIGLLSQWGGLTVAGKYIGETGNHSYGGVRSNGFQQVGPLGGGVSLQRFYEAGVDPVNPYAFEDVLNVTGSGRVGIGETHPAHKLQVNGSAGATSWNVISSRAFKEDIQKVDPARYRQMLAQLRSLDLASYRYKTQYGGDGRRRVGLVAEDLPRDLLSKDGKSVDLYELTSVTIGAMKAQQQEIDATRTTLDAQRATIEAQGKSIAALQAQIDRLIAASDERTPRP